MDRRYEGKPLLRLLECYVLHAIGELSKEQIQKLDKMTPKLQQVYKLEGTWIDIIENVMDFSREMPLQIVSLSPIFALVLTVISI